MSKLRCWAGLHSWVKHTREGESWLECRHCGTDVDQARAIFGSPDSKRW